MNNIDHLQPQGKADIEKREKARNEGINKLSAAIHKQYRNAPGSYLSANPKNELFKSIALLIYKRPCTVEILRLRTNIPPGQQTCAIME